MSIDNIVFEEEDTAVDTITKTVYLWAGSSNLKTELKKLGITNYRKVAKGALTRFVLETPKNGTITVKL